MRLSEIEVGMELSQGRSAYLAYQNCWVFPRLLQSQLICNLHYFLKKKVQIGYSRYKDLFLDPYTGHLKNTGKEDAIDMLGQTVQTKAELVREKIRFPNKFPERHLPPSSHFKSTSVSAWLTFHFDYLWLRQRESAWRQCRTQKVVYSKKDDRFSKLSFLHVNALSYISIRITCANLVILVSPK